MQSSWMKRLNEALEILSEFEIVLLSAVCKPEISLPNASFSKVLGITGPWNSQRPFVSG